MGPSEQLRPKPRLLIILNRFVIGGQAVDTIPLAFHLKDHFDILVLYGQKEQDELEATFLLDKYKGLSLKKIPSLRRSVNPLTDLKAFFAVRKAIKSFNPHIVHTHGAKSGFIGRLSAYLLGVPVIIHTFHGHFFHSYFSRLLTKLIAQVERLASRITTAAVALSETQKKELVEVYRIFPEKKITVIPLGFEFDEMNDSTGLRASFRTKYGLKENDVAIGIVGRIVAVKNHGFFVSVVEKVLANRENANAAFFIVGDGDLRRKVEEDFAKQDIPFSTSSISENTRVVFTSWIPGIYEVMNGLDIVVLTSLNEGTPLSIIEAQFFGKPVISTNVGGVKDTLIADETGFITEPQAVQDFATKTSLLINNPTLRNQMGESGQKFAVHKFSKLKEVESTRLFYKKLLQQKKVM